MNRCVHDYFFPVPCALDKLAPATFLGGPGVRFEYTVLRKADDVRMAGVGWGLALACAPLLAAADVSACMPQGAALTQAKADLLLLGDSLSLLPLALDVARAAQARIRENLCWALGYNLLVLPLAMTGTLAPWLAAAGMSLSSLLVVANALRLERVPSPSLPSPA